MRPASTFSIIQLSNSREEEYMEECGQVFIQMMDCLKDNGLEDAIHVLAKAIITGKKSTGNNHQI